MCGFSVMPQKAVMLRVSLAVTHTFPHSETYILIFLDDSWYPSYFACFFLYSFVSTPGINFFCILDGPPESTPSVLTWSFLCFISSLSFVSYISDHLNQPTSFFHFLPVCLFVF